METSVVAFLLSVLVNRFAEEASSKISKTTFQKIASLRQKTQEELEEDFQTRLVWNKLETSNGEEPPIQTLEIIADTLQGKINTEPDFAREAEEVQHLFETELQSNYSTDFQEYVRQIQRLTNKIKVLQKDVDDIQQEIKENVGRGDYLGKDPGILSGNQNFIQNINQGNSNFLADTNIKADVKFIHLNKEYTQRILTQIEQIKGKITQIFTVKESMDELDKIRQLYPISVFDFISNLTFQNLETFFKLVFALGKFIKKNIKNYINQDDELIRVYRLNLKALKYKG
ncbi:MAG: hypothetical protein F6K24_19625 [Okeania sp. SIO2D1]|nr:hypothetical protein [Okeania sp. SIO2D1]